VRSNRNSGKNRYIPRPVELKARMLGNSNSAEGKHKNDITKIDDKHGKYVAKIVTKKIIGDIG